MALTVLMIALAAGCGPAPPRVVVYSAQDREFAEPAFARFTAGGAVVVDAKFDTEANKSVSLAAELLQEVGRPRCDVHWNNEPLGTVRLARKGVYERYESPSAAGYPESSRPADRTWQAFAARARVLIVNTDLVPEAERPTSILDLTAAKWRGKVAMAKPQFGTTATQAACLFEVLGPDDATAFYRGLKANGVAIVAGNKQVATDVSSGRYAVGMTDTDDALIELNAGKPVVVLYPDRSGHPAHPRLGTLFLPNTLAVVKGCPNPAAARALVDHLLAPESEAALASAGGFQIPLHPAAAGGLPAGLVTPTTAKSMAVDWEKAADQWDAAQAVLRDEFAR